MGSCHDFSLDMDDKATNLKNKILLMGNPNVGKSVIFSALSGMHVLSSNFAGTTVTYTKAKIKINKEEFNLIDVPGTYSLSATSQAEQVAINFMNSDSKAVICVLDASNLHRNLNLALEIKKYNIPVIFSLNLLDVAERRGIKVNTSVLSKELGAPVIDTIAVKGIGIQELKNELNKILFEDNQFNCTQCPSSCNSCGIKSEKYIAESQKEIWKESEQIVKKCVNYSSQKLRFIDRLGEKMIRPFPGIPIAIFIMILSLALIVGGGKALRATVFLPIVNGMIVPFFKSIFSSMNLPSLIHNILIGEYGIFVIGFEWPISLILPYVTLFYIVFSFLEDCGYLPRVAVLFDGIMRKIGVQGGSLISLMMGFGCAVPAIIGTRTATTRKERIIITAMICFAVPCVSQSAALIALLGSHSLSLLITMIIIAILVVIMVGLITGKIIDGRVDPIILEIPNLLMPEKKAYFKKLFIRLRSFLIEAEGPMLIAIVIAAIFKESGLLDTFAGFFEPLLSGVLGLPKEAVIFLILGVIRREMAVVPLLQMSLTPLQLLVGATVSLLYLPCLSVFGIIANEFDAKVAVYIGISTFVSAILLGGFINIIGNLIL